MPRDAVATWAKTEAGRTEMQARTRVKERAQRNLLLLIDGQKSEATLLAQVAGTAPQHFLALESMGLIERMPEPAPRAPAVATAPAPLDAPVQPQAAPLDYAGFTTALTQVISQQLGLRGLPLTLAVEKAATLEALHDVARRTLEQVGARKGPQAAEQARRALYGG